MDKERDYREELREYVLDLLNETITRAELPRNIQAWSENYGWRVIDYDSGEEIAVYVN